MRTVGLKLREHFLADGKPGGIIDRERIEILVQMGIMVLETYDSMFDPRQHTDAPVIYLYQPNSALKPLYSWLESLVWIEAIHLLTEQELECNMAEVRRECWTYTRLLWEDPPMTEGELLRYLVEHTLRDPDLASRQP